MDPNLRALIYERSLYVGLAEQILALLPADDEALDALVAETVATNDARAFNYILISAVAGSRRVDARHLAKGTALIANGDWLCCLAWKMHGDVAEHLVAATRDTVMNLEVAAAALIAAAVWSIDHRDGVQHPDLVPQARALARIGNVLRNKDSMLAALAEMLDDNDLRAVLRAKHRAFGSARMLPTLRSVAKAYFTVCHGPVAALIVERPYEVANTGTHIRRAVPRIGRNEPCPCGSGKKYKRCCFDKDQERLRHSSDVPGKTKAEVMEEPEPHLTAKKIQAMPPYEVARLDVLKIAPKLLPYYFQMVGGHLLLDEAASAFEKLGCETEELQSAWNFIAFFTIKKQRLDVAQRLMKVRYKDEPPPDTLRLGFRLLLAREDPARYLELMEETAKGALTSKDGEWLFNFVYGIMMGSTPALGIHCARSLIPFISKKNATSLLGEVEKARDRLKLPPEDPVAELLERRFAEEIADGGKDAEELRKARERLNAKAAEVNHLKESLEQLRRNIRLQEKKDAPTSTPQQPNAAESQELRDLREKVRLMKSSINERNQERATLRRELGQAYADLQSLRAEQSTPAAPEAPDAEDALLLPGEVDGNQPPRLIEFPHKFHDTISHLPRQVSRTALALLGRIAAGDPTAFTGAVRLKGTQDVLRVRIGADHRLLFRLLPEHVQVVDLINRRDLERCIAGL